MEPHSLQELQTAQNSYMEPGKSSYDSVLESGT